jgi:methylamine dehydrogenase heavy chain
MLACCGLASVAAAQPKPALPVEQSDVATLPAPFPHRVFLWSGFQTTGVFIVDADKGKMEGFVPRADWSNFAVDPAGKAFYVAESFWTRGTRGDRLDMVSVYDGSSLNLLSEIPIPGRLLSVPATQSFALSDSGHYAYAYSMAPAASVVVVDLQQRKTRGVVEIPGCALALPYGEHGFVSLCGDGSLAGFALDEKLKPTVTRTAPLFDPAVDPAFDTMALDGANHLAFLVSYDGLVWRVRLQDHPTADKPWSLQASAGVRPPPPSTNTPGDVAWRPGGGQVVAYHAPSHRLFVLMHPGEAWSHKEPASELWVLDAETHTLLRRIDLRQPFTNVAVSQDKAPQLYLTGFSPDLTIMDPDTGKILRSVDHVGGGLVATSGPQG